MKKVFLFLILAIPFAAKAGGPVITGGIFPQVIEGSSPTNNNRVEFWCWVNIGGLNANATYHYFTAMDTVGTPLTGNGAGLPVLINPTTGSIRRILNPSMTANTGYDSITASATGTYSGWFGVEPTGNFRFTPGTMLDFILMLNNGSGGTTVSYRLAASAFPITVMNFGIMSASPTQGSAVYDSLDAAPRNFICLYDNTTATGRPVNIAIVEDDSLYLRPIASIAAFYRNRVDSLPMHWGALIPNNLPNGIRALEERDFLTGMPIDTSMDADGIWCSGLNTVNMSSGNTGKFLNSTFMLSDTASIPDTTYTNFPTGFTASSNSPVATYMWNFGDTGTASTASASHTYLSPGVYLVQVVISTGGCSDTITHTVVVLLSTFIPKAPTLWFGVTPNPATDYISISTRDNDNKTLRMYDILGETILTRSYSGNNLMLDLAGQQPGIYFLEIKDEVTGRTGLKKIIIQ